MNSGKQCLTFINDVGYPEVVIVGMQLSDMMGFDLIKLIRDDSEIPVIVISFDKDIQKLVKAFDVGANDYMVYPFNEKIFIAKLKALIRRREWDMQARVNRAGKVKDIA
jgi:two-component system KDP operon response regulator KdpE